MKKNFSLCMLFFVLVLNQNNVWANESKSELQDKFNTTYVNFKEFWKAQDYKQSLEPARLAYEYAQKLYDKEDEKLLRVKNNYGVVLYKVKQYPESIDVLASVYKDYKSKYGRKSFELVGVLMSLGKARAASGKNLITAKKNFDYALKIIEGEKGKEGEYVLMLLEVGYSLLFEAKSRYARLYINQAYEILLETVGGDNQNTGYAAYLLGRYYAMVSQETKAIKYLELATKAWEHEVGKYDSYQSHARGHLVAAYEKAGQRDKATQHCLAIGAKKSWRQNEDFQPLYKVAPVYPLGLVKKGIEGHVVLEFTVDDMGFVSEPKAIEVEGGEEFVEASLKAIENWRYAPKFVDGEPVKTEGVRNLINFELADK